MTTHNATPAMTPAPGRVVRAQPSDVRRINRSLVFRLLFPDKTYSRAELGRRTGLSRVAISDVVGGMLDEGLIKENGLETGSTGKGKRGILLSVDPTRLRIICVDISQGDRLEGAVLDLTNGITKRMQIPADLRGTDVERTDTNGSDPTDAYAEKANGHGTSIDVGAIERIIVELLDGIDAASVIGIGLIVSGIVDDGIVRISTMLDWHDVDLRSPLERRFHIPVTVTNDVIASMLTEHCFGRTDSDMLFVKIGRGIGAATLIGGIPVIGTNQAAGEIGHISVDPVHGPLCPCGKRGCLERMISASALRGRMQDADPSTREEIIAWAGTHIADALAMPVGLLDLADVCIYGPPDIVNDVFLTAAQHRLDSVTASHFHAHTTVRRCGFGDDITLRGGAIAVERHHLDRY